MRPGMQSVLLWAYGDALLGRRAGWERLIRSAGLAQLEAVPDEGAAARLHVGEARMQVEQQHERAVAAKQRRGTRQHAFLATLHIDLHDVDMVDPAFGQQPVQSQR